MSKQARRCIIVKYTLPDNESIANKFAIKCLVLSIQRPALSTLLRGICMTLEKLRKGELVVDDKIVPSDAEVRAIIYAKGDVECEKIEIPIDGVDETFGTLKAKLYQCGGANVDCKSFHLLLD